MNKNQQKEKTSKSSALSNLLIILLIAIIMVTSSIGIFAWAKYTSATDGNATAQVAKWSFKVVDGVPETSDVIEFAVTRTDGYEHVEEGKLAPGTFGEFQIGIDATGTETVLTYTIEAELTNKPTNLKLYADSAKQNEIKVVNDRIIIEEYLSLEQVKEVQTKTIYWEWPYETGDLASEIVSNDAKDTIDAGKTMTMVITVTGTEVLEEPQYLVKQITAVNYGDAVNYSVTVKNGVQVAEGTEGATTLDNWKVFYNDGTYVYMIYGDYLPNSATKGIMKKTGNNYAVDLENNNRKDFITALNTQNNWTQLLSTKLKNIDGIIITGSPTVEQYSESWNQKYPDKKLYINYLGNMDDGLDGCYVGDTEENTSYYVDRDNSDSLYYPHKETYELTDGYWLMSTSATWYGAVANILYAGSVGYRGGAALAVRPVIGMPANVQGTYENGVWNIE